MDISGKVSGFFEYYTRSEDIATYAMHAPHGDGGEFYSRLLACRCPITLGGLARQQGGPRIHPTLDVSFYFCLHCM